MIAMWRLIGAVRDTLGPAVGDCACRVRQQRGGETASRKHPPSFIARHDGHSQPLGLLQVTAEGPHDWSTP